LKTDKQVKILADSWYASVLEKDSVLLNAILEDKFPSIIIFCANKIGVLRGFLMFVVSLDYPLVVTTIQQRGTFTFLLLEALFRNKNRVIFLEFIRSMKPNSQFKRIIYPFYIKLLITPILKRTVKAIHVLTDWERGFYADMLGLPEKIFVFIPWPLKRSDAVLPNRPDPSSDDQLVVLSSGRSACDWDTLFKAAEDQPWVMEVICSSSDLRKVNKLNNNQQVKVLSEITRSEHHKHLREAAIYVLCLSESEHSSGHIRISNAIVLGTPIIATDVKGIEGYLIHGETGILVLPGEPLKLRNAINALLSDLEKRKCLVNNAFREADKQTREDYLRCINKMVESFVKDCLPL